MTLWSIQLHDLSLPDLYGRNQDDFNMFLYEIVFKFNRFIIILTSFVA